MIYTGEPTELDRIPTMEALAEVVKGCQRCGLRAGCTQVVFGEGVWPAGLMCIGEGPGADEDRLGR
ncbi:uracil-DNA glycosylase, partial [Symbiobacterium thermophilum]